MALLAGCTQAIETPLPELGQITRHLLSAEEQKKAIEDLNLRKETHQADAIKAIEQEKTASGKGAPAGAAGQPPSDPLTTRSQ